MNNRKNDKRNEKRIKSDKFFHRNLQRETFSSLHTTNTTDFDIYAIKEAPFTLNRVAALYIT